MNLRKVIYRPVSSMKHFLTCFSLLFLFKKRTFKNELLDNVTDILIRFYFNQMSCDYHQFKINSSSKLFKVLFIYFVEFLFNLFFLRTVKKMIDFGICIQKSIIQIFWFITPLLKQYLKKIFQSYRKIRCLFFAY